MLSIQLLTINANEVTLGETRLVFSYSTLVAVRTASGDKYKTSEYHSRTTSKHIALAGFRDAPEVTPDALEAIALNSVGLKASP